MNLTVAVSGTFYSETVDEGNGRDKGCTRTRQASIANVNQGHVGVCQLTKLFFDAVEQNCGRAIQHSSQLVLGKDESYVKIEFKNLGNPSSFDEIISSEYDDRGREVTERVDMTICPMLKNRVFHCSQAVLTEIIRKSSWDAPDLNGGGGYTQIHQWTFKLGGAGQEPQTFTFQKRKELVDI